jgi:hypothetical protein
MGILNKFLHKLRVWTGFDEGLQLTPSHGWLLPAPVVAHREPLLPGSRPSPNAHPRLNDR